MTKIQYLTAEDWKMRWARPPVSEKLLDPECFVHHVGGNAWMRGTAQQVFTNLNEYAINGKGYSALDYDVLVHYDEERDILTIGEGRGKWMSAATHDRNEQGEAVCATGNYSKREPLPIELEGIALGIVYGINNGWIAKDARILGHRDNPAHPNATGCPGDFLYPKLNVVRARVLQLLAGEEDKGELVEEQPVAPVGIWYRDRMHYFTTDADRSMRHSWEQDDHTLAPWEDHVSVFLGDLTAVTDGTYLDVFGRGTDNAIWGYTWDTKKWNGPYTIGGGSISDPIVTRTPSGVTLVTIRGLDNKLYVNTMVNRRWYGWGEPVGNLP